MTISDMIVKMFFYTVIRQNNQAIFKISD